MSLVVALIVRKAEIVVTRDKGGVRREGMTQDGKGSGPPGAPAKGAADQVADETRTDAQRGRRELRLPGPRKSPHPRRRRTGSLQESRARHGRRGLL